MFERLWKSPFATSAPSKKKLTIGDAAKQSVKAGTLVQRNAGGTPAGGGGTAGTVGSVPKNKDI